jgi:hypothetical protein
VESDEGLADTAQTINFGSVANTITDCSGNMSFGPGNQFTQANISNIAVQFIYFGPVIGDSQLEQCTVPTRVNIDGQTFIFSSLFLGQTVVPSTPSTGGFFYVDTNNAVHYLGAGGQDTVLARSAGPVNAASVSFKPGNPIGTTSTTAVMMGFGSTCVFTPQTTGKVRVTICGNWYTNAGPNQGSLSGRYGTGTAPNNGVATTGTRFGTGAADMNIKAASTGFGVPFAITEILTLVAGTAYWFDLAEASTTGTGTTETANVVCSIDELAA